MKFKLPRGYQRVVSAYVVVRDLKVGFGNGDRVIIACRKLVPPRIKHVRWAELQVDPDGVFLSIPAQPIALEVSWDAIRCLTDENFARSMAVAAAKQARSIGKRLRELRRSRKLTQAQVASRANIEQANLSRIENGHFDVATSTLWKLLGAMGYSARDLVS